MTAENLGNYCSYDYCMATYSYGLMRDVLGMEIIQIGKKEDSLGFEITQTRYNTGLFRVLWEIASDGIAYLNYESSPSAGPDKSVFNLKSDIIEQYWQSTSAVLAWFSFDVGLNKTTLIDTFALIGTTITSSASITLKGSNGHLINGPWTLITNVTPPSLLLEENIIWISESQPKTAYRYFKVTIEDPTNTTVVRVDGVITYEGYIRIGRCVAGTSMMFTEENCIDKISYKKENYKDEFSINGFTSIANNRSLKKSMEVTFNDLNRGSSGPQNYSKLMSYVRYCRDTLKALVIVDPSDPYIFSVFSKLKDMPQETHSYMDKETIYATLTLSYDEAK